MLTQLTITNFAIVRFLELDLFAGMTTITGETGAGKSIAIDALGLCLGQRADASVVRPGCTKAEISASFDVSNHLSAKQWLQDNALEAGSDSEIQENDDCILRRTISKEGRSRGYINGIPVPVSQLKLLGQLLVNIHGQHAHQLLVKPGHQLKLLDQYAGHQELLADCAHYFKQWHDLKTEKKQLLKQQEELDAKKQLLEYQIEELDDFSLQAGEYKQIEEEHSRLANSSDLQICCLAAQGSLFNNENNNAQSLLQYTLKQIEQMLDADTSLAPAQNLLHEVIIQVDEVQNLLMSYEQNLEMDPVRFQELELRLSTAIELARKHHVDPYQLTEFHQQLQQELAGIRINADRIEQVEHQLIAAQKKYNSSAQKITKSRQRNIKELNKLISSSMQKLNMPSAQFSIAMESDLKSPTDTGIDRVDFEVSANVGQPLQPLAKVASGGELSRISLAIEVIIASRVFTPTLIFDEVDVGVSGPTAVVVGKMMRTLGEKTQVICVTHLPQVAGTGHQQMRVSKSQNNKETITLMEPLNELQRLEELARLLGGDVITSATMANAKELIL